MKKKYLQVLLTLCLQESEQQHILNIAPAEGKRPLSVFRDKYCEELAYPGIFLGQARSESNQRKVKVCYSDICKSELRRSDRRAAMCVENIFYKAKKLQMKTLLETSHIALRKCRAIKTTGSIKQRLILLDEGCKFLNVLRRSPPFFKNAKKDLFAMIKQLGPAKLFCSFSSAETQWLHLLKILGQLVDHKQYTDEKLENFNWEDRCRVIQSDHLTCARLLLHLIKISNEPLYCFLSGGAGVGKSHVTKASYQAALKYYSSRAGDNFAELKVLMLAA